MKKLLLIVVAVMIGGTAHAELIVAYGFDGSLADVSGNGYDGIGDGAIAYAADVPEGLSGQSLVLDGDSTVEAPISEINPFDGSGDFSIAVWFKTQEPGIIISSARDNTSDNHSLAVFILDDGEVVADNFWVAAANSETVGFNDGQWHHVVVLYASAEEQYDLVIDGESNGSSGFNPAIPNIVEDTVLIGNSLNAEFPAEEGAEGFIGNLKDLAIFNHVLSEAEIADIMANGLTNPLLASNPRPGSGETLVALDAILEWDAPIELAAARYNVYFGTTDPNDGENPEVLADTDLLSYDPPGDLESDTQHFWRVDVIDPNDGNYDVLHTGHDWTFRTMPPIVIIVGQPQDVTLAAGEEVEFTVEALNPNTYQWYKTDTPDGLGAVIDGATSETLTIESVSIADEGYYYCVVSNLAPSSAETRRAKLITERMIAHYTFDGDASDATGTFDGTAANDPNYTDGVDGQAVDLDGISQYIALPAFGPLDQVSISVWVNVNVFEDGLRSLMHTDGWAGRPGSLHAIISDDEVRVAMQSGPEPSGGHETPEGEWMHIVYTYEIVDGDGIARLYVNGELGDEVEGDKPEVLGYPLKLGVWLDADELVRYLNAKFDDVRFYNYAISALNVASLYTEIANEESVCFEEVYLDFDDDCQVNLLDLAIFFEQWLECNIVPECIFELP